MKIAVCVPTHNEPDEVVNKVMFYINQAVGEGHIISRVNDKDSLGKGFALREASRAVEADYYIFIDGDGDIDPSQIKTIFYYLTQGYDVVVGKKQMPHKWSRKLLTWMSRVWIYILFGLAVDTQTGLKGFNYRPDWHLNGWAFDIEILHRAKKMKKKMIEIPVHAVVSSGEKWQDIASTLRDTIKLRFGL